MLFAIVDGLRVAATPNKKGLCQLCGESVISRCGDIYAWHWAHTKNYNCDKWLKSETEWQKRWKLAFGINNCEKIIIKEGVKHIADVSTVQEIVIEFQNSPIKTSAIIERELFYGEKMLWVINGKRIKEQFSIYKSPIEEELKYFKYHNPLSPEYGKQDKSTENEFNFKWSHFKKSWAISQRHIFIDFGDDQLFWICPGQMSTEGKGKQISKRRFLEKYRGDLGLLETLIDS